MEKNYQEDNKKKMMIIGGIALVVIVVIILIVSGGKKSENPNQVNTGEGSSATEQVNGEQTPVVPQISENLPEEVKEVLQEATIEAPGASLVTRDDKVVNDVGVEVKNDAAPMTAEAPRLSAPIEESQLPSSAIKLRATSEGFSPKEIKIKSGTAVTLSLTSDGVDSRLVFEDANLKALEIPVPAGYTMAKTFNAPSPGSYTFYQDIPGRSSETGVMIVE